MSGFVSRWARRKAEASRPAAPSPAPVAPVDEASLPKLETLGADSDFSAFLAAGVSAAMQTQALQIAWRSDAAIAAFRGMAEYDWDFNAAGYGRLAATDDVAAMLRGIAGVLDRLPEDEEAVTAEVAEIAEDELVAGSVRLSAVAPTTIPDTPVPPPVEADTEPAARVATRRHGGALPA